MLCMHTYLSSSTSFLHCLLPALPKAHSDAEGGPLNLPQSLVIMLAMLNFLILFVQQYIIIICSHPRPLQHTSPQYVGLDAHYQHAPASDPLVHVDEKAAQLRCALCVFMPSSCQASFRPLPLSLKYLQASVALLLGPTRLM